MKLNKREKAKPSLFTRTPEEMEPIQIGQETQ